MDKSEFIYWRIIKGALDDGLIYQKGETLYCYKKTAKMLNSKGYELDMKEPAPESDFVKSLRKQGLI